MLSLTLWITCELGVMQATSKKAEDCVEAMNFLLDRLETWHTIFPQKTQFLMLMPLK